MLGCVDELVPSYEGRSGRPEFACRGEGLRASVYSGVMRRARFPRLLSLGGASSVAWGGTRTNRGGPRSDRPST